MCGIAGLWSKTGKHFTAASLSPALTRLRHRGPDDEGFLVADGRLGQTIALGGNDTQKELGLPPWSTSKASGDCILGHRRLSILDLSPRGHQPMSVASQKCWIVFNGEIYNYVELREELKNKGHEFHSESDTEVILHAWLEWGEDCLNRFNGDWAFALLDQRTADHPLLFLARDRWGVKPLFYAETADAFWFASESKALLGHAVPFAPSEEAVFRFLAHGALPAGGGGETFFDNIKLVPPGGAMRITREGIEALRWYDLRKATEAQTETSEEEALAELSDHITRSVRIRLRADVPVGSCLSGGVDSSSIVGTMRDLLKTGAVAEGGDHEHVHTFSAVYRQKGPFNEADWIEQVVKHSDSKPHYTYPDDVRIDEVFDRMVWHQDEPFQTSSIFAQWCVMQCARENGVVVMLDGQAADELLGGYQPGTYQAQFLEWMTQHRYGTFFSEWNARRRACGWTWGMALRELGWILQYGAFGGSKPPPPPGELRSYYEALAMNESALTRLVPDAKVVQAKLVEEEGKLTKLIERQKKKPKDTELPDRIVKKKAQIVSLRRRLSRAHPSLMDKLRVMWSQFRGQPAMDFREYLLTQTLVNSLPSLLRFEDRNSMAFSVEARVPFTDYLLVEWAFKRANAHKISKGWTKWILRAAMKGRAPESILWRRDKVGFETPDVTMTRMVLESAKHDPVQSEFLSPYLDKQNAAAICQRVRENKAERDEGRLVWRWLVLDSWQRQCSDAAQITP